MLTIETNPVHLLEEAGQRLALLQDLFAACGAESLNLSGQALVGLNIVLSDIAAGIESADKLIRQ